MTNSASVSKKEQFLHWLNHVLRGFGVHALSGTAIGLLSWHLGVAAFLIFLAPAWRAAKTRVSTFYLFLAYYLVGASDVPAVFQAFFGHGKFLGFAIWIVHGVILAAPYALLRKFGAPGLVAALLITALPPLGLLGWLSPMLAAGALFPGDGVIGYVGILVIMAALAAETISRRRRFLILVPMLVATVYVNMNYEAPQASPLWFGQNTDSGDYPKDSVEGFARQQELMQKVTGALNGGAKLIVLPEGAVGEWLDASEYWWADVISLAKQKDATLMIGGYVRQPNGRWKNAVVIRGADNEISGARIPMPAGLWKPFLPNSFEVDIFSSGLVGVQGKQVSVSVCYEDLLLWPALWSFVSGDPTEIVSVANNWFGDGLNEPKIQAAAIGLQARLYGIPLIRALNSGEQ